MSEIAVTEPITRPKSVVTDMATRYGMETEPFAKTVRAIAMPANHTLEQFAAFLLVAKEYRLNPLTKEIYAFPAKGGGIIPVVSIDGWISLVNSHPACDGFQFSWGEDAKGELVSCTCTMHRKDRSHPVIVTEYLSECIRPTEPWKMKRRMLRHKTMIQAARYAFGFSGIYDEDEGEKIAEAMKKVIAPPPPPAEPEDATDIEVFDLDAFMNKIADACMAAESEDALIEAWDALDVESTLTDTPDALAEAFEIRNKHLKLFEDAPEEEQS